MKKFLFVGSFLSKNKGTKDVAEKISIWLKKDAIDIELVSRKEQKLLRILDIVFRILTTKSKVVHFDVFSGQAFLITKIGSALARLRKKKIIMTLRGGALKEFAEANPEKVTSVLSRAHRLQSPSHFLIDYFKEHQLSIHYLPNPVYLPNFPYSRENVQPFSLLWVRAFTSIYNPELAVRILAEVRLHYPTATLTMVGPDKGELGKINGLIDHLNLRNAVEIVGPVPNEKLSSYYHRHAVYLNTTSYESFGMAIVEAAACGIPIVSTSVGEIPYLWQDEKNMMLVPSFDAGDFLSPIRKIFDDALFADQLSKIAREKILDFDWEIVQNKWKNILLEA